MGRIQLGYLENHPLSFFTFLLARKTLSAEEKPIRVNTNEPLMRQIENPLSELKHGSLEYVYLITSLESVYRWSNELSNWTNERFWIFIPPEFPEIIKHQNLIQKIKYNKTIILQFLSKDNLAIENVSYFQSFISHLLYPEMATELDYKICDSYIQRKEIREVLINICESNTGITQQLRQELIRKLSNKEQKESFITVSYIIRQSLENIFKIEQNLKQFLDQTKKTLAEEVTKLTTDQPNKKK